MEIKQLLMEEDIQPHYDYNYNLGKNPGRHKLETMCDAIFGSRIPANNVRFSVRDVDGDWFMIIYNKTHDEFAFEKLTVR